MLQNAGVVATKAPFVNFSVSNIFDLVNDFLDYSNHIYIW